VWPLPDITKAPPSSEERGLLWLAVEPGLDA
jgi:hypothetical protein